MTTRNLSYADKRRNLLQFKIGVFERYIAQPLELKYTVSIKGEGTPDAFILFDIALSTIRIVLKWEEDCIILNCNNQNRVIKDSLLSQEWFLITVATLVAI